MEVKKSGTLHLANGVNLRNSEIELPNDGGSIEIPGTVMFLVPYSVESLFCGNLINESISIEPSSNHPASRAGS